MNDIKQKMQGIDEEIKATLEIIKSIKDDPKKKGLIPGYRGFITHARNLKKSYQRQLDEQPNEDGYIWKKSKSKHMKNWHTCYLMGKMMKLQVRYHEYTGKYSSIVYGLKEVHVGRECKNLAAAKHKAEKAFEWIKDNPFDMRLDGDNSLPENVFM